MKDFSKGYYIDYDPAGGEYDIMMTPDITLTGFSARLCSVSNRFEAIDLLKVLQESYLQSKSLLMAQERIQDMLEGDDGQAWKEAEKYLELHKVKTV